jgi:hypothetical protein
MSHERPSPFTIPEPTFKFAEGPPSEPPPPRQMTVDGLIRNLIGFADFYEQATAAIETAAVFEKPHQRGGRDAYADYYQRCFRATPGIDRVRAYVLSRYGDELTIGTARRVLGDLIRIHRLLVEAAGALTLEAAMDRLDVDTEKERSEVGPSAHQPDRLSQRGESVALPSAVRNWLTARYLADPTPALWQCPEDAEPEPIVFVRYEDFAEYLLNAGFDLLPNLDTWKNAGWIADVGADCKLTDNPADALPYAIARLNLPIGRHRLIGIRKTVLSATIEGVQTNSAEPAATDQARHLPVNEAAGRLSPSTPFTSPGATIPVQEPSAESNPLLLNQVKKFLAEKDQEEEARQLATRLLPYILFPPNGPFGSATGTSDTKPASRDAPPAESAQGEGGKPVADGFADLRRLARDLSKQERAFVEALCDAGGELSLVDVKTLCDWQDPIESAWNSLRTRLNKKLESHGWKVTTKGRAARITKTNPE